MVPEDLGEIEQRTAALQTLQRLVNQLTYELAMVRRKESELQLRQQEVADLTTKVRSMMETYSGREDDLIKHHAEVVALTKQLRDMIEANRVAGFRPLKRASNQRPTRWLFAKRIKADISSSEE